MLPLFIFWLIFCLLFSLLGFFIPKSKKPLSNQEVIESQTICRVLHEKDRLSLEDYAFESNEVAARYDEVTFIGYMFIVRPIVFTLEKYNFMDGFILVFVRLWIRVQRNHIQDGPLPVYIEILLTRLATMVAKNLGGFLSLFLSK